MNENMQLNKIIELLYKMDNLCKIMPNLILENYYDKNKYLFLQYYEAFNSIKGFCVLLKDDALVSQACMILRTAIEHTATIRVLEKHKELMDTYKRHQKFRFKILKYDNDEKKKLIKEEFKDVMDKTDKNPLNFLEYGWLKNISEEYGLDTLIKLSEIQEKDDAIKEWKDVLNQWTHGSITTLNLLTKNASFIKYCNYLVLIAAKLLDCLMIDFHKETNFNFVYEGKDLRLEFLEAYKTVV